MSGTGRAPKIDFYVTRLEICPYLPGRSERKVLAELELPGAQSTFEALSRSGFRRSRGWIYRPACPSCSECVAVRVVVDGFRPSRSFRRIAHRNRDLELRWVPPRATPEQYALFRRYLAARHGDGDMAGMSTDDFAAMVEDTPVRTSILEARAPDRRLAAAALVDRLGDGLSAVYSFFDPDLDDRSLGSFLILHLIEQARHDRLPHVYLGYWVPESRKMAYKARFQPLEAFGSGGWRPLAES